MSPSPHNPHENSRPRCHDRLRLRPAESPIASDRTAFRIDKSRLRSQQIPHEDGQRSPGSTGGRFIKKPSPVESGIAAACVPLRTAGAGQGFASICRWTLQAVDIHALMRETVGLPLDIDTVVEPWLGFISTAVSARKWRRTMHGANLMGKAQESRADLTSGLHCAPRSRHCVRFVKQERALYACDTLRRRRTEKRAKTGAGRPRACGQRASIPERDTQRSKRQADERFRQTWSVGGVLSPKEMQPGRTGMGYPRKTAARTMAARHDTGCGAANYCCSRRENRVRSMVPDAVRGNTDCAGPHNEVTHF